MPGRDRAEAGYMRRQGFNRENDLRQDEIVMREGKGSGSGRRTGNMMANTQMEMGRIREKPRRAGQVQVPNQL